jgi:hypothetical protein
MAAGATWIGIMAVRKSFVVCVRNEGYPTSLELRKIYETLADADAAKHDQVRVIDEAGEDYLYPAGYFAPIDLTPSLRRAVLAAE